MDFKAVFIGLAMAFCIALGFYNWSVSLNTAYVPLGGGVVDTSYYSGYQPIGAYVSSTGQQVGNTTSASGQSQSTSLQASKSASVFGILGSMLGFVPNQLRYGASILGIPPDYTNVAVTIFLFAFGITLAYMLYLGGWWRTGGLI